MLCQEEVKNGGCEMVKLAGKKKEREGREGWGGERIVYSGL